MRLPSEIASDAYRAQQRERRERIATAALQGLLAGGDRCGGFDLAAEQAVGFADALIAALSKDGA